MYNYNKFEPGLYDYSKKTGLMPGAHLPNLVLQTRGGTEIRLYDVLDKMTVLETGSLTCPLYVGKISSMNALANKHKNFNFAVIYIREAHPGKRIESVSDMANKIEHANTLADFENENRQIYIDTVDGELHHALGLLPNMVYVISTGGQVLHRSDWNTPDGLDKVLTALENGQEFAPCSDDFKPVPFKVTLRVLYRAGGIREVLAFLAHLPTLIRNKRAADKKAQKGHNEAVC